MPWRDRLSRVILAHKSPGATDFTVLDAAGGSRILGAVSGSDLTCSATSGLLHLCRPGRVSAGLAHALTAEEEGSGMCK